MEPCIWVPTELINYLDEINQSELERISSNDLQAQEFVFLYSSNMLKSYFDYQQGKSPYIHLMSSTIRDFVGRRYIRIRDFMLDHAIIHQNTSYQVDHYPMTYRFSERYLESDLSLYKAQNKTIQNRIVNRKLDLMKAIKGNEIAEYLVHDVYPYVTIPADEDLFELGKKLAIEGVRTNKGKLIALKKNSIDHTNESIVEDSIDLFNKLCHGGYMIPIIGGIKSGGRVFDSFSLAPSWCRSQVKINGQNLVEIDFNTLHPNLAIAIYGGKTTCPITHDEVAKYLGISRSEAKRHNLSFFNLELGILKYSPLYPYYKENHPEIIKGLINDKLSSNFNNVVSSKFLSKEVELMTEVIKRIRQRGIKALYVYDALYTTETESEEVKEIMNTVASGKGIKTVANINYQCKYSV